MTASIQLPQRSWQRARWMRALVILLVVVSTYGVTILNYSRQGQPYSLDNILFYTCVIARSLFVVLLLLLPSMIVHYLGNVTIGWLTAYLQSRASIEMQALYGVILSFGVVPTTLMILWTRFFSSRWLPGCGRHGSPDGQEALLQPATAI